MRTEDRVIPDLLCGRDEHLVRDTEAPELRGRQGAAATHRAASVAHAVTGAAALTGWPGGTCGYRPISAAHTGVSPVLSPARLCRPPVHIRRAESDPAKYAKPAAGTLACGNAVLKIVCKPRSCGVCKLRKISAFTAGFAGFPICPLWLNPATFRGLSSQVVVCAAGFAGLKNGLCLVDVRNTATGTPRRPHSPQQAGAVIPTTPRRTTSAPSCACRPRCAGRRNRGTG